MYTLILSDSCESSVHVITSCLVQRPIQLGWCLVLAVKTGKCDCRFTCQFHLCFWSIFFDIEILEWLVQFVEVSAVLKRFFPTLILANFWNQKSVRIGSWFGGLTSSKTLGLIHMFLPKIPQESPWKVSKAKWNAEKNWGFRHGPHAENWQSCGTHWWEHGLSLSPQGHQCLLNIQ